MHLFGTLIFNSSWNSGAIEYGWSEVYPLQATTYAAGATALAALAALRLPMMCTDTHLVGSRLSDGDVRGDSYPTGIAPAPGTYITGTPASYLPEQTLRILQLNIPLQRASRWIRAIPDDQYTVKGIYTPTGPYIALVDAYGAALETNVCIAKRIGTFPTTPAWAFTNVSSYDGPFQDRRKYGRPFGLPHGRRLVA